RGEARGLPAPSRHLPFPHEEAEGPYIPATAQAPVMTNVVNDLVLSNILSTIARENIRYIGLHATDPRDKIFLASLVRENCPDVRLFTISSNLLLAHPDYAFAMRGALVASTYPLHPSVQRWSDPYEQDQKRPLFAQQSTQGTYNAVLWQLDAPEKMIGFSTPQARSEAPQEGTATRPPVWLSLVSPTGPLVPLDF